MRFNRREVLALAALAAVSNAALAQQSGVSQSAASLEGPNGIRWITLSSGHKVWTQRLGRGETKVLLLSGGPGLSHEYMQCFAEFLPKNGYELYFYDQLGCGQSDKPTDKSLWALPRFVDEVDEVRAALGLDQMIIVGHSWGSILGIEYALRNPNRLAAFVLSNMSASFADYGAYVQRLRQQMPQDVQARMTALELANETTGDEYQGLLAKYLYGEYICRLATWPDPVQRSLNGLNTDIYVTMQGPDEFTPSGNLRDWNRWADLHRMQTPTLVMGARYDEMNPDSERREAALIPNAELFISKVGSHLAMWDDQENYFAALLAFLDKHRTKA